MQLKQHVTKKKQNITVLDVKPLDVKKKEHIDTSGLDANIGDIVVKKKSPKKEHIEALKSALLD